MEDYEGRRPDDIPVAPPTSTLSNASNNPSNTLQITLPGWQSCILNTVHGDKENTP